VAAEGLLAFFAQADFFGIFLWERKIDFANNKCNFSSTRNTFWCHAHSAVSLPHAKDYFPPKKLQNVFKSYFHLLGGDHIIFDGCLQVHA
jgi:hypothetical protein